KNKKMKQKLLLTLTILFITGILYAQVPQKISYQSVIRTSDNQLIANAKVGVHVSILEGSENGAAVYAETHKPTTDANGVAAFEIGGGEKSWWLPGLDNIDWSSGVYYIKVQTDPAGG